jgi:hypothetical protein
MWVKDVLHQIFHFHDLYQLYQFRDKLRLVQTIDKEDKVDRDLNELRVIDPVHDEVIQLLDKELESLFIK